MKIVRLSRDQITEWRANVPHLVDAEGHLVAQVDKPLQSALDQVTRSARSQRKSITQRVSIGSGPSRREHVIAISVTRTGINDTDLALGPTIDGHRVVSGREVFQAKMFQLHGECQLRMSNGVILKVVRDPAVHRPTFTESQQIAPRPEHCPCKSWGRPHPGTHYSTCQWNRLAPPDERAPTDSIPEDEVTMLPTEAFATLQARPVPTPATAVMAAKVDPHATVAEPPPLDAPESCRNGCLDWATPKGFPIPAGQHHPTCQFAKAWMIKTARDTPRWLVDLNDGEKVRLASDQEVGEADVIAQRTGSPIIHIEGVPYAVVLETELDAVDTAAIDPALVPPLVTSPASGAHP